MRVVWSPLALDRAAEAAKHIARDGPEVAAAWVDGLFDVVGKLVQFPRRGRVVPEVGRPEIRELLYKGYRVVYRVDQKQVLVLTARHQRRRFTEAALEGE
ncbi:MAG: type II toxin-antitoxin system RelE/ParE family toxin [Gemmatimonadetes bacterium]|nr:type II toxin-antitoxin system RelE/ParE family toxin [Gemmatimonadota bacterium]